MKSSRTLANSLQHNSITPLARQTASQSQESDEAEHGVTPVSSPGPIDGERLNRAIRCERSQPGRFTCKRGIDGDSISISTALEPAHHDTPTTTRPAPAQLLPTEAREEPVK
ncbi:hypothetical protein DPEC_G00101590 [Dallia pectoralis]|uniref:Uncharacterized protein n=1 Tax=Dallia pectoralis TaxID=75939 RepID=A0ACC2GWT3_DALPE|nr:hypothetical protein DPEC_G00101590 [Dallia pectoralis]